MTIKPETGELKRLAMVDYDPVKEEACLSFYTSKGNHKHLWVKRQTFAKLMGPNKEWNVETLGEKSMWQKELIRVVSEEISADLETCTKWFKETANDILRRK